MTTILLEQPPLPARRPQLSPPEFREVGLGMWLLGWTSRSASVYPEDVWSEPRLTPKDEALQGMRRRLAERRWRGVLQGAEDGKHVSLDYLVEIMALGGVPQFAAEYAALRFSGKTPPGRPARPPLDPRDPATLWYHFDGGPIPWRRKDSVLGLEAILPSQFFAVGAVKTWGARYAAFETRRKPNRENLPRLRHIKSRGVWKVRDPKGEARRRVAKIWGVRTGTLAEWEQQTEAWTKEAARLLQARKVSTEKVKRS